MKLEPESLLLRRVSALNNTFIESLYKFVGNGDLSRIAKQFDENLGKRHVDIGFNLFALISEVYHRENLHSDILRALIDPAGGHGEKEIFLRLFLDYLSSRGAAIDGASYRDIANVRVVREQGRIDLLIADQGSMRAIIIENKINNAGDMQRQIPRYLEHVRREGYECDAIIYVRLHGLSRPDTAGWTAAELSEIKDLLTVVCAYDESETDLFTGWLLNCEKACNNIEAALVFRQYSALIKKLGANAMNKPLMEEFYRIVIDGENFKTALSLKAMIDDLVAFRVEKVIERFNGNPAPFTRVANWKNIDAYFTGVTWEGAHLGIDIDVSEASYSFRFWDRNDDEGVKGKARAMLQKMGVVAEYSFIEGACQKTFAFPSGEAALYSHIECFKVRLCTALAEIGKRGATGRS